MKLIKKLVDWFEDLLWIHAVKEGTKIKKKHNCDARLDGDSDADLWVDDDSVPNEDMRPDNEVM